MIAPNSGIKFGISGLVITAGLIVCALDLPSGPVAAIFLITVVVFTAINSSKGALHPACWFSPFYFAYATFYSLSELSYGGETSFTREVLVCGYLAYLAFMIPVSIYGLFDNVSQSCQMKRGIDQKVALFSLVILCLFSAALIFIQGASSKREVMDSIGGSNLSYLLSAFVFLSVVLFYSQMQDLARNKTLAFNKKIYILSLLILVLGFGVTGERDYIFRYGFMIYILVFTFKYKFRFFYPFLILIAFVIVLPFSQSFKSFLLPGGVQEGQKIEMKLFEGEFISAGRNLDYIISAGIDDMKGVTYLWDLKRSLLPGSDQISTGKWFNDYLRVKYGNAGQSGWGFSQVAEGYMNFGELGVLLQYLFFGIVTVFIYRFSFRNSYTMLFYIFYSASFVYVQRGDFANYIGFCLKINLAFVLFLFLMNKLQSFVLVSRRRSEVAKT